MLQLKGGMKVARTAAMAAALAATYGAIAPATAIAQSESSAAAATAIWMTPFGRVATVNHAALGQGGHALGANYSSQSSGSDSRANGYAGLLDWGALQFQVAATEVSGLSTVWSGSASYGRMLVGGAEMPAPITVGLELGGGYGRVSELGESLNAVVGGARLPVALALATATASIAPYVAPGFFMGRLSAAGESETGTRATVNAGVRTVLQNGLGFDVGAQRTFIDEAKTVFGAGLSYSFR